MLRAESVGHRGIESNVEGCGSVLVADSNHDPNLLKQVGVRGDSPAVKGVGLQVQFSVSNIR